MADRTNPHRDLAGYLLGVLTPEEASAFEEHLRTCRHCREERAELGGLPDMLRISAVTEPPPGLRQRTFEAVAMAARAPQRRDPGTPPGQPPGPVPAAPPGAAPGAPPGAAPRAPGQSPGAIPGRPPGAAPGAPPGASPGFAGGQPGPMQGAPPESTPRMPLGPAFGRPAGPPPGAPPGMGPGARPGPASAGPHRPTPGGVFGPVPGPPQSQEGVQPSSEPTAPNVIPMRPRRRTPRWLLATAAALIVVAAVGLAGVQWLRSSGDGAVTTIALSKGDIGNGRGEAQIRTVAGGREVRLQVSGLQPNGPDDHYECWFVGPGDTEQTPNRVAVGSFVVGPDGSADVTMTAAADPTRYPKMGVTLERNDGNPDRRGPKALVSP